MKKVIYKIIYIFLCTIALIILSNTKVHAASASLTATPTEPKEGESVTVSANVTAGAWNLKLSGNGKSETIYGYTQSNANASDGKSITFTAGSAGTTYTFTLTGDMTDITADNSEPVNKTITINVAKTTNQTSTSDANPGTTTNKPTPQPEEPNFKNTNKTMYASKDINLRASWSTNSKATSIDEGTELTVTATSTNKVNGYVWYKVSYNGSTLYVASNLLTNTKPEEKVEEPVEEPKEDEPEVISEEPTNEEEVVEPTSGLKKLEIEGLTLSPEFSSNTYEYRVIVKENLNELKINAVSALEDAEIVIAGNSNLQEGENLITIMVYNKDNTVEATYQITVNKSTIDLTSADKLLQEGNNSATRNLIIFFVLLIIAIIGLIVVLVLKRRNQNFEEDNEEPFTENEQNVENVDTERFETEKIQNEIEQEETSRPRREKRKGKHF